jgi:serine/threonine protein phosphatase 1
MKLWERRRPRLPDGLRIYALSDIHGCADLLARAFDRIDHDTAQDRPLRTGLVFLGDYVDRGLDSCRTLDILIERTQRRPCVFLKGNHEEVLLNFLQDPPLLQAWRQFGGLQTLISYGLKPSVNPDGSELFDLARGFASALPPAHLQFLKGLRTSFTCGDYFFVHAGVRPGIPLDEQADQDLLWIREEFLASRKNFGKFIVHGHTPVVAPDLQRHRVNIDTGAYATGRLTLLRLEDTGLDFLEV